MRILIFLSIYITSFSISYAQKNTPTERASLEVIRRFSEGQNIPISVKISKSKNSKMWFETKVENGVLKINGNSGVAITRGFYDFIKRNRAGISSWSGNRLELPSQIKSQAPYRVESMYEHFYYFNVVTFGYSTPYWNWERWEKEIDWMAFHGIDMPLALIANEAISARVWKKLGLNNSEIENYFVGPAHLPWMRMGNISGIDGPLTDSWHKEQVTLQHKILARMRSLGMKPICPAFAGFVPQQLKRIYPKVEIQTTTWGGAFHNFMLSPNDDLFHKIGKMFIEEWEKEFGVNEYYIADSFNEMEIPFPPKNDPKRYNLLSSYGDKVYRSIHDANKNAIWVMQGWMFGYQRDIWDYNTLHALLKKVPNDKMLLLDLAVDYNFNFWKNEPNWDFYKGFFNKPWVYSVIPNMGGKSGPTGILEFYANGHLSAVNSKHKGKLLAYGMAPEGIENNEVLYELYTDAGWKDCKIDLLKWLEEYNYCRYGFSDSNLKKFWDGTLKSIYGSFTDHPRFIWQFRPGRMKKGSIDINKHYDNGFLTLAKNANKLKLNKLLIYDLREWASIYLGDKIEKLTMQIERSYDNNELTAARNQEQLFIELMEGIDRLLLDHPTKDLRRWLNYAKQHGENYEKNARRIITVWGPPVDDYAARIWSGLIGSYYLPRWKHYFEERRTGNKFDFSKWEKNWVDSNNSIIKTNPPKDYIEYILELTEKAKSIDYLTDANKGFHWKIKAGTNGIQSFSWHIDRKDIATTNSAQLLWEDGKMGNEIEIGPLLLELDGKEFDVFKLKDQKQGVHFYNIKLSESMRGNNSSIIKLSFYLKNKLNNDLEGSIILSDL